MGVAVGVGVGVAVGVAVGVGVAVCVGVGVDVAVCVGVGVDVAVCVGVAVCVAVGVDVAVCVAVAVGVEVVVGVAELVGVVVAVAVPLSMVVPFVAAEVSVESAPLPASELQPASNTSIATATTSTVRRVIAYSPHPTHKYYSAGSRRGSVRSKLPVHTALGPYTAAEREARTRFSGVRLSIRF
ncbi:hypothetical protein [Halococcus sp. PRR34]|uniref:hypothetical protein n=1 Tax=Halococcus sp. PRR34 TaxID=3020830 RepID=UPI00235DD9C1|nr:hypothetical protein [Halococcus sp. PRR34]